MGDKDRDADHGFKAQGEAITGHPPPPPPPQPGVKNAGGLQVGVGAGRDQAGEATFPGRGRGQLLRRGAQDWVEDVQKECTLGGDLVWHEFSCYDYSHFHQSW